MNVMLLLAQVAPALTDSIAGADTSKRFRRNEFMEHGHQRWLDYDCLGFDVRTLFLHLV